MNGHQLSPAALAEAQRILDSAAQRLLEEEIAASHASNEHSDIQTRSDTATKE